MWCIGRRGGQHHPPTTIPSTTPSTIPPQVFPILVLIAYGRRAVANAPAKLPPWRHPAVIIGGGSLVSLIVSWWLTVHEFDFAFFLMPSRLWQLASGALLFDLQALRPSVRPFLCRWYVVALNDLIAVVSFAIAFAKTTSHDKFPLPWSLLAVAGTLAYTAAGIAETRYKLLPCRNPWTGRQLALPSPMLNSFCATKPVVWFGKISYPLYLWQAAARESSTPRAPTPQLPHIHLRERTLRSLPGCIWSRTGPARRCGLRATPAHRV